MSAPWGTTARHESYVVARLVGDIDIANVEQVRSGVLDAVDDAAGLIVDLSAVRYVDSAGVHMLFDLVRRLEGRRQGTAIVVPDGSPIGTLLKITNVTEAAPVCGTVEECGQALREQLG